MGEPLLFVGASKPSFKPAARPAHASDRCCSRNSGMNDEEEIRSQLMLPVLAFLRKAFRRRLPLLQHESGRSAGIGEVEVAMPAALRALVRSESIGSEAYEGEPAGAQLL
ncbi:hypothetical protein FHS19_005159 [Paenibacillus rhizosphaerae]|uniref:Uncharacterized protein n=1 Tax=Paenibacillus rhizosphaerae TaxID=297318 RepID=A0A839TTP3_9BACL|nr:hypothetical protein [Paenibacillus rhizosphaerae]